MNEKERKTGRLSRFFEEKGFYIILFLCAAAIGIAGYVLFIAPAAVSNTADTPDTLADALADFRADGGDSAPPVLPSGGVKPDAVVIPSVLEDPEAPKDADPIETAAPADGNPARAAAPKDETADSPAPDNEEAVESAKITGSEKKTEKTNEKPTQDAKDVPKTDASAEERAPDFFVKPVAGDIIRDFCVSELLYDRTMGDWRTHNGADFSAVSGEAVLAVADGTVREVSRSDFYGTCVVISHSGGMESRYFGLAEQATVKAGDAVKAGDTIGSLEGNCHFEALEPVHLHMELRVDGKYVNPGDYIS